MAQFASTPIDFNTIAQLGAIGVLMFFGIALVFFSIGYAIKAFGNRNSKPADAVAGSNTAITALATAISDGNKRFEGLLALWKEDQEAERVQRTQSEQVYIKSLNDNTEANVLNAKNVGTLTGLWNETHQTTSEETTIIKETVVKIDTSVQKIDTIGSEPLQDVQKTVNRIEDKVKDWSTVRDEDTQLRKDILGLLRDVDTKLSHIDERLKTKEMNRVPVTHAPPVTNTATVIVPEQELKVETSGVKPAPPPAPPAATGETTLPVSGVVSGTVTLTEKPPK